MDRESTRIEVDIIACDGQGYCAELLPERITLDEWGYPIVRDTPLTSELMDDANRAVRTCPVNALSIHRATR